MAGGEAGAGEPGSQVDQVGGRAGAINDFLDRELQQDHDAESGGEGERGAAAPGEPADPGEHETDADDDLGAAQDAENAGERLAGEGPVLDRAGGVEVAGEAVVEGGEYGKRHGGGQHHDPDRRKAPVRGKDAKDGSS